MTRLPNPHEMDRAVRTFRESISMYAGEDEHSLPSADRVWAAIDQLQAEARLLVVDQAIQDTKARLDRLEAERKTLEASE